MDNRRFNMKTITVLMFVATFLLWLVLLLVKYVIWGINAEEIFNDFVSNMLGILPPIIIFNFIYEYLTKKHVADEMAEEITKTLMSNPEAIDGFDEPTKKRFIHTTISTIVGDEYTDMVCNLLDPYITYKYNSKKFFKYTINLREYKNHSIFTEEKYMKVYENLKFKKTFHAENELANEVTIGFFFSNSDLDKQLHFNYYLFRENLFWNQEETEQFMLLTDEEKEEFVKKQMSVKLYIDNEMCIVKEILVNDSGIYVSFVSKHSTNVDHSHAVELSFTMPQRKGHSQLQVSINEPTYSPVIQLSYPEDSMKVEAFSFMNDGEDSMVEAATRCIGGYEFCIQDKWIYPMSGIVFIIDTM